MRAGRQAGGAVRGLPQRDLLALLEFLEGAGAIGGPRTFAAYVTSELTRIIPSALTGFAEFDLVRRSVHWVMDPPSPDLPNLAGVLATHIDDDPFILYQRRTGDAGAVRLSDLITTRAFQHTGLYREFYRPLHLQYSMACALSLGSRELAALALYRGGADFSERDRLCLDLVRPHLVHFYRSAEAMARNRRDLVLLTRGVEAGSNAIVVMGRDGRIRRATNGAERWLAYYLGPAPRSDHLPASLREWVQFQEKARGRTDTLPPVRRPFVVEREGRRLMVHLVSQPPDSVLVLEEVATRLEPAALTRLGLSAREAEVLALAAAGKTNPAIAALLKISSRTVQTHLEHVYRKLRVHTRTAAAARALEAMRKALAGVG
jgi:DNA-binding CsgD family transcriptional regulator